MKANIEYHENGHISYIETIKTISDNEVESGKYPNARTSISGKKWVRVGLNAKYHDNGVMAWGIYYDEFGNVDKSKKYLSRRKDGTVIDD